MQYQYQNVNMEIVMENPSEFIIPECQKACETLWKKNIETYMCSNYDYDQCLWITFILTGKENEQIFYELMREDSEHYDIDTYHHKQRITASNEEELLKLVEPFKCQDVRECHYEMATDFLNDYRSFHLDEIEIMQKVYHLEDHENDMPNGLIMDEYGRFLIDERYRLNPAKEDTTLSAALEKEGKTLLYVESEGRVYSSPLFLKWHLRYLKSLLERKIEYGRGK